eukprot:TRINITY_DN16744_c0_g1_i1.p1 TRINITY_DN16744_c0_g1~~TRINITY_DN16744_c0_g1_i1.p1  ORF type:complete len:611 (-),score=89.73 TRINITY_DN16744_c0_g1_i1:509-2236(-)
MAGVRILQAEPHEVPTWPAIVGGGSCRQPWLYRVDPMDAFEAVARPSFALLHARPGRRASDLGAWLLDDFQEDSSALKPALQEHAWFGQAGSGAIAERLSIAWAQRWAALQDNEEEMRLSLVTVQLYAYLRSAGSGTDVVATAAKVFGAVLRVGQPRHWANILRSRWARSFFSLLAAWGDLVCDHRGLASDAALSTAVSRCDEVAPETWLKFMERIVVGNTSSAPALERFPADNLLELTAWGRPLFRQLAIAATDAGALKAPRQRRHLPAPSRSGLGVADAWRHLRASLGNGRGARSRSGSGAATTGILTLQTPGGATARVLAAALAFGDADDGGLERQSEGAFLEVLLFFEAADGCASLLTVGSARSLPQPSLVAWRCKFSASGVSTSATASSSFGTEWLIRCPLPAPEALGVSGSARSRISVALLAERNATWSLFQVPIALRPRLRVRDSPAAAAAEREHARSDSVFGHRWDRSEGPWSLSFEQASSPTPRIGPPSPSPVGGCCRSSIRAHTSAARRRQRLIALGDRVVWPSGSYCCTASTRICQQLDHVRYCELDCDRSWGGSSTAGTALPH